MEMKDEMFNDLLRSAQEADDIIKGKAKPSRTFEISAPDIKGIRDNLGISQTDFAFMIGVSIDTLQNWEQERRRPQGPALALLTMFKNNPKAAFDILHLPTH
jgi:putative transcriptional regulator